jgi:hypothetical protein
MVQHLVFRYSSFQVIAYIDRNEFSAIFFLANRGNTCVAVKI